MIKYFNLLMVAIFATMSFAIVSCGDDNDEPSSDGSQSAPVLKVNGIDTYSTYKFMGVTTVDGSYLNTTSVETYEDVMDFDCDTYLYYDWDKLIDEGASLKDIREDDYIAGIRFFAKEFDPKTAKKGDVLTIDHVSHFIFVQNNREHVYKKILSGQIEFYSFSTDKYGDSIITLRFKNVVAEYSYSYGDDSNVNQTITLDGLALFKDIN